MKKYIFLASILAIFPTIITAARGSESKQRRIIPSLDEYSTAPEPEDGETDNEFFFSKKSWRYREEKAEKTFRELEAFLSPLHLTVALKPTTLELTREELDRLSAKVSPKLHDQFNRLTKAYQKANLLERNAVAKYLYTPYMSPKEHPLFFERKKRRATIAFNKASQDLVEFLNHFHLQARFERATLKLTDAEKSRLYSIITPAYKASFQFFAYKYIIAQARLWELCNSKS